MNYQVNYLNKQKHTVHSVTLWANSMAEAITKGVKGLCKIKARQIKKADVKRCRTA
jgi:hypothetical protein